MLTSLSFCVRHCNFKKYYLYSSSASLICVWSYSLAVFFSLQLQQHLDNACQYKVIRCPYFQFGCLEKVSVVFYSLLPISTSSLNFYVLQSKKRFGKNKFRTWTYAIKAHLISVRQSLRKCLTLYVPSPK